MGIYLYSVRAKSIQVEGRTVHALAYLTKPSYGGWRRSGMDRHSAMLAGKAESYWAGKAKPEYVALTTNDNFEEFQTVRAWDGRATDEDTPSFAGSKGVVGFLKKVGKSWTMVTEVYSVTIGTMKGDCLHVRTSGRFFFSAEAAMTYMAETRQEGEVAEILRSVVQDGKVQTMRLAPTWHERMAG
jgi:hypothetical protein